MAYINLYNIGVQMPKGRKPKIDISIVRQEYEKLKKEGNFSVSALYDVLKNKNKMDIKKTYVSYLVKNKLEEKAKGKDEANVQLESDKNKDVKETEDVQIVTGNEVKIEDTPGKEEANELRESYKKMLQEVEDEKPEVKAITSVRDDRNYESKESAYDEFGEGRESDSSYSEAGGFSSSYSNVDPNKIDLSGIASLVPKTFWGFATKERPLSPEEKAMVDRSSEGLSASYGDALVNENAPIINYLAFGFVIPSINRMDIIVPKLMNYFRKGKPQARNQDAEQQAQEQQQGQQKSQQEQQEANNENEKPVKDWDSLTPQAQAWILDLIDKNYSVDPNYSHGVGIDLLAFRDAKILRNVGSSYGYK